MPKQTKICRVCGKEYEACNSIKTGSGVFNWREVACSPECGMLYLEVINESRGIATAKHDAVEEPARVERHTSKKKKDVVEEVESEYTTFDAMFEELPEHVDEE